MLDKKTNPLNHHLMKIGDRYYIQYSADGKQRRESLRTSNVKEARHRRDQILGRIADGSFQLPEVRKKREIMFDDLCREYLEQHIYIKVKSERSLKRYKGITEILKLHFGDMPLSKINSFTVNNYRQLRQKGEIKLDGTFSEKTPAAGTINKELSVLRTMMKNAHKWFDASKWNLEYENPFAKGLVTFAEEDRHKEPNYLTKDEIRALLAACDENLKPIVFTALQTGCRRGELFNLCWRNIRFDSDLIILEDTKGGQGQSVVMPGALKEMLQELKPAKASLNDPVFVSPVTGKKYVDVKKQFKGAMDRAGITQARREAGEKPIRFHDLRTTFASHLAMSSGSLFMVQKALRHKDPRTSMIYASLAEKHKHDVIDRATREMFETAENSNVRSMSNDNLMIVAGNRG